jgi:serine/threonine protein kinase
MSPQGAGAVDLAAAGVLAVVDPADEATRLGRYQLYYQVGGGGMAEVFLARDVGATGLDRWVAIKRVLPHLASEEKALQMLVDEARLAARIAHPNVAQVIDIGDVEGAPFLVMEYLHGEPLSSVLRRIRKSNAVPDMEMMARIVANACEGAHAAHELRGPDGKKAELVHRDFSPQNLFVTYDGSVKVVDFGIAKAKGRIVVTEAGTLKGKFAYMSPEQASGREVDRRSDIFSLGIVLWEATTGRRLFEGDSDLEALRKVQEGKFERPAKKRSGYPTELEAIVMKALAVDKNDRFATAREMATALEEWLVHRRAVTSPARIADVMHQLFADRIAERERLLSARVPPGELPAIELTSAETASTVMEKLPSGSSAAVELPPRPMTIVAVTLLALAVVAVAAWFLVPFFTGPPASVVAQAPRVQYKMSAPLAPPPAPDSTIPPTAAPPAPPALEATAAPDLPPPETSGRREHAANVPRSAAPESAQPAEGGFGLLNVQCRPWAWVTVDGNRIRESPIVGHRLSAGPHRVRLETEDGQTKEVRIVVPRDGTVSVNERF